MSNSLYKYSFCIVLFLVKRRHREKMCFSRQIPVLKNNFQSQCEVKDLIDYFCLLSLKRPAFQGQSGLHSIPLIG